MIDTHTHINSDEFKSDRDDVIARFFDSEAVILRPVPRSFSEGGSLGDGESEHNKVERYKFNGRAIIVIGADKESNKKALEIVQVYKNIFCTLGFHPTDRKGASVELSDKLCRRLEEGLVNEKVVALGEIGLDYFWDKTVKGRNIQKETFIKQLKIVTKVELPVIIHCRDAYQDVYDILNEKFQPEAGPSRAGKVVIHCYGGSVEDTEKFLSLSNVLFSFTGNITFVKSFKQGSNGAKLRKQHANGEKREIFKVIRMIPLERIMVETDSPFLAPVPHRGKRNEPCYVKYVIEKIAEIKELSFEKVEKITDQNAIKFFNLPI